MNLVAIFFTSAFPKTGSIITTAPLWLDAQIAGNVHPKALNPLSGAFEADSRTHFNNWTSAAPWGSRNAKVLTERHKNVVIGFPVPFGELGSQGKFRLIRGFGLDISPQV
jgi:hypothetical protein